MYPWTEWQVRAWLRWGHDNTCTQHNWRAETLYPGLHMLPLPRMTRAQATTLLLDALRQGKLAGHSPTEEIAARYWLHHDLYHHDVVQLLFDRDAVQTLWPAEVRKKTRPVQADINAWMGQLYQKAHDAGDKPPKREAALRDCVRATGAADRQARAALTSVPAGLRRERGRPRG
jgi:hypothetical protein